MSAINPLKISFHNSEAGENQPPARSASPNHETAQELTTGKIKKIYTEFFNTQLQEFIKNLPDDEEGQKMRSCLLQSELKLRETFPLKENNFTKLTLGFYLKLESKYKGTDQVGFFNFDINVYRIENLKTVTISCLSEISLEAPFKGKGLFKLFISPYTEMLKKLEVGIDYLHVKSEEQKTASLYKKYGYSFTPDSLKTIQEEFKSETAYLEDSSVSFRKQTIEMFRSFSDVEVKTSIPDLQLTLTGSPKGVKRSRCLSSDSYKEEEADPFFDSYLGYNSPNKHYRSESSDSTPSVSDPFSSMLLSSPSSPATSISEEHTFLDTNPLSSGTLRRTLSFLYKD